MQILFYSRDVFLLDRALIRGKSPTKWGMQMTGMNFQTRSRTASHNKRMSTFHMTGCCLFTDILFFFMHLGKYRYVHKQGKQHETNADDDQYVCCSQRDAWKKEKYEHNDIQYRCTYFTKPHSTI